MGEGELLEEQNQGDDEELSPIATAGDSQLMVPQRDSSQMDWSGGPHPLGEKSLRARGVGREEADGGVVRGAGPLDAGLAGRRLRPAGDTGRCGVPSAEGEGGGRLEEGVPGVHGDRATGDGERTEAGGVAG